MVKLLVWGGGGLAVALLLYAALSIILVRRELDLVRGKLSPLDWKRISYASSVDKTGPLHALVIWPRAMGEEPRRLLVLMHGYTESAADYFSTACHWAREGYVVLVPDMRGRVSDLRYPHGLLEHRRPAWLPGWNTAVRLAARPLAADRFTSAGKPDSGGLEVVDIRDAVRAAREHFGPRLAPGADILGYSGGGTSALLAAIRMPHQFQRVMAFYPIVDFAAQEAHLKRLGHGPLEQLRQWMGGEPHQVPARYAARRLLDGLANLRRTRTKILADSEDEVCPVEQVRELKRRARALPYVKVRISNPGDPRRWHHDTPNEDSSLHQAPLPDRSPHPSSVAGQWVVLGYLITSDVEVWIGDGQRGIVRCAVSSNPGGVAVDLESVDVPQDVMLRVRIRKGDRWVERDNVSPDGRVQVFFNREESPQ